MKKHINLFIVDDNKVFSLALKAEIENTFKSMFVKVSTFETGELCMEKFKEENPRVVILDYHLNSKHPDAADGLKVLNWIKKENKETNVIMLTSDDNIEIAIKSFKHEASDYIVKTETQFKKINYSVSNLFRMMEAKNETKVYKILVIALFLCIAFMTFSFFY